MKILIVDDELHARQRLRRLLGELDDHHQIIGETDNGAEAIRLCRAEAVDLVLLDVRMPGLDGLEVAERLAELDPPPAVILITAFSEYALEAFERNVADYLVKPVRRERLGDALERVCIATRAQCKPEAGTPTLRPAPPRHHLSAHYRGGVQRVPIDEIIYLQAEQKYVTVHHTDGKMLVDESLKALEQEFPDQFVRIHRSALVSRDHLAGLEKAPDGGSLAILRGSEQRLPISRRHLPMVRRFLRAN